MSLRLHPKYGVNATIPTCFWCGKDKNELVMLGAAYKGQAPMHMLLDQEPCDMCKANMTQGITFAEALEKRGKPVFTGTWCVVKETSEVFGAIDEPMRSEVLKTRKAFVSPDAWDKLGLPRGGGAK